MKIHFNLVVFLILACATTVQAQDLSASWELKDTPVKSSLRGLSVPSAKVVWASGSGGTWLRTIDGGESWDHGVIAGLDSLDFRSIYAFDKNRAVAVSAGEPTVIYATRDGGETWTLKASQPAPAFLDGIDFIDDQQGYVFGDPVDGKWMILTTEDGGESWELLDTAPKANTGEAGFAASASSMVAEEDYIWIGSGGTASNIWQSKDRGVTWESFNSPLIQGEASQGIFAICQLPDMELVAVGGDYVKPESKTGASGVFSASDNDWVEIEGLPAGFRSGVAYLKKKGWVISVGTNGSDISLDNGRSWLPFSEEGFHAVRTDRKGKTVWTSGLNGKIAKLIY